MHQRVPISAIFKPAAPVPASSMSTVISSSSARLASEMTTDVAAVTEVFSPWSIVSFVDSIEVPFFFF
jgi:hypothetical protein